MAAAGKMDNNHDVFRSVWHVAHSDSFHIQYVEAAENRAERRRGFVMFLHAMALQMRCAQCRVHLRAHLRANPISPRTDLARYVVDLHNAVNRRQHKREVSFDTAKSYYLHGNSLALCPALGRCTLPAMQPVHVGIIVSSVLLIVAVILVCAYAQRKR